MARKPAKSNVLLRAAKFTVERRTVRGHDHRNHERQIVVHPGAVVVLPIRKDGRIVMIDQYRLALNRRLLELPAGTLDEAGEDPADCAARELEEETGYRARTIKPLCRLFPSPGILTELIRAYVATDLKMKAARPEPTENIRVVTMPFDEALEKVRTGKIVDAKTMITLMYYHLKREGRG